MRGERKLTNRDKLIKTSPYDLLCEIQSALSSSDDNISGLCIIEDITKRARQCPEENWFGSRCRECIANWLNEEAKV